MTSEQLWQFLNGHCVCPRKRGVVGLYLCIGWMWKSRVCGYDFPLTTFQARLKVAKTMGISLHQLNAAMARVCQPILRADEAQLEAWGLTGMDRSVNGLLEALTLRLLDS